MQRALALVLICQTLKIPKFEFNVQTSFNFDNFKLKSSFIPQQIGEKPCRIIIMMAIYQVYIQGEYINNFCNKINHKTFQKLFFDKIFSVIDLFIEHYNKNQ